MKKLHERLGLEMAFEDMCLLGVRTLQVALLNVGDAVSSQ
jgi:hypothetical protein